MEIVRKVDKSRVRAMCIRNDLYTCGTNEQYEAMFRMCESASSDNDFVEIVRNIYQHSETERELESIAFDFFNDCTITLVKC